MRPDMIVRIAQDYEGPDLIRQTPGRLGVWDGIYFTQEPVKECDYLIVLRSQMRNPISVSCPKENVWAIVQDPYYPGFNDWLVEGYEQFSSVFTPYIPYKSDVFIPSHPALPWYVNRSYDQLMELPIPPKSRKLSWITGNQADIPGHFKRKAFLDFLRKRGNLDFDLFGRAGRYLEDKSDGLLPYRYSLAIENSSMQDYWTEKIADCFLCWTVPIYYGCRNLERYFPPESFIRIDIEKPEAALSVIKETLMGDAWDRRLPALKEARELFLNRYQFFPYFSFLINKDDTGPKRKRSIEIPVYKKSMKAKLRRLGYKIKRNLWRLGNPGAP